MSLISNSERPASTETSRPTSLQPCPTLDIIHQLFSLLSSLLLYSYSPLFPSQMPIWPAAVHPPVLDLRYLRLPVAQSKPARLREIVSLWFEVASDDDDHLSKKRILPDWGLDWCAFSSLCLKRWLEEDGETRATVFGAWSRSSHELFAEAQRNWNTWATQLDTFTREGLENKENLCEGQSSLRS